MADLRHLLAIYVHAHRTGNSVPPHIDAEARAALADEPAVPQGREPVAVTGQPSEREIAEWINSLPLWHGATRDELTGIVQRALARWGNPAPAPPADGEVAECAAELLQQQALPEVG